MIVDAGCAGTVLLPPKKIVKVLCIHVDYVEIVQ